MNAIQTTNAARTRSPFVLIHDPLPGTGYQALRRIGAGASSEVFEALGPEGTNCAVKVLRSVYLDDRNWGARLLREGRTLSLLKHDNLVPVLDVGTTTSGRPYFAMPLLLGQTLRETLTCCGKLAVASAVGIATEMLEGLDAAHRAGIIHRDVKPSNVFLTPIGRPKDAPRCLVLDFGIAKAIGTHGDPTTTEGVVLGSPGYLAPEQILGGAVDARTDVYSAGLTVYEMLAGRGPYDAEGPINLMRAHLEDTPRDLCELAPVSKELARIVERAMSKKPARRWPSARAFAEVLRRTGWLERDRSRRALDTLGAEFSAGMWEAAQ